MIERKNVFQNRNRGCLWEGIKRMRSWKGVERDFICLSKNLCI